jgi:hypothetical protein
MMKLVGMNFIKRRYRQVKDLAVVLSEKNLLNKQDLLQA